MDAKNKHKMLNSINDALNVKEEEKKKQAELIEQQENNLVKSRDEINADEDYEYARKKLKNLVDAGEIAIDNFNDVCEETSEPRAYEVLANLIKTTGDLAKSVMDNAKTKSAIDKERRVISRDIPDGAEGGNFTQHNQTIFIGSTKDLLESIRKEQEEAIDAEFSEETEEDEEKK